MMDAGFEILREELAEDVRRSIDEALSLKVEFGAGSDPASIFRDAVQRSTQEVVSHPRGKLCQRFLRDDPFGVEGAGGTKQSPALTDAQIAGALFFVRHFIVAAFQGCVAELLAAAPVARLLRALGAQGTLPASCRLLAGDATATIPVLGRRRVKGADMLALAPEANGFVVHGVAEVKSYAKRQRELMAQVDNQLKRMRRGFWLHDRFVRTEETDTGTQPVRIGVVPAEWKLPAGFRFESMDGQIWFVPDPVQVASEHTATQQIGPVEFRVTLGWSEDALTEAGMALTMNYMQKVGEAIYRHGVPAEWAEMTPAQAGGNAVMAVLHQAVIHLEDALATVQRTRKDAGRRRLAADAATLLYNSYCFGYAIAQAHGYQEDRPRMLFYEDLKELASPPAGVVDQ